jgi:hypothetical protein
MEQEILITDRIEDTPAGGEAATLNGLHGEIEGLQAPRVREGDEVPKIMVSGTWVHPKAGYRLWNGKG